MAWSETVRRGGGSLFGRGTVRRVARRQALIVPAAVAMILGALPGAKAAARVSGRHEERSPS